MPIYTQYQPKEILKKYNEEIDGVKKDSIVLGKCGVSLIASTDCFA